MSKPTQAQDDAMKRLRRKHRDAQVVGRTPENGVKVTWTEDGGFGKRTIVAVIHEDGRRIEVPE